MGFVREGKGHKKVFPLNETWLNWHLFLFSATRKKAKKKKKEKKAYSKSTRMKINSKCVVCQLFMALTWKTFIVLLSYPADVASFTIQTIVFWFIWIARQEITVIRRKFNCFSRQSLKRDDFWCLFTFPISRYGFSHLWRNNEIQFAGKFHISLNLFFCYFAIMSRGKTFSITSMERKIDNFSRQSNNYRRASH